MRSDWRALLPYVDEGGITVHMEQKTKMGSKQPQRERLNPCVERGVSEEHGVVALGDGYSSAQTKGQAPSSRSGICPLNNTHKEISTYV